MINADTYSLKTVKIDCFDEKTKNYVNFRVKNFHPETSPGTSENYYFREYIEGDEAIIGVRYFLDKVYDVFKNDFFYPQVELAGMWINRVDNTSNQNDDFHRDINKFSTITFLNDDFEGGCLEYWNIKDNVPVQIKLEPFTTFIFEGSKFPHRVLPVLKGTRYTLISFWDVPRKDTKTLL